MSAPQSLLQAALNRFAARLGSGLADTAASLASLAQDAPVRLQQELTLFWEEVQTEAERLESRTATESSGWEGSGHTAAHRDPQDQIDALRARVAALARRLEQQPQQPPQGQR